MKDTCAVKADEFVTKFAASFRMKISCSTVRCFTNICAALTSLGAMHANSVRRVNNRSKNDTHPAYTLPGTCSKTVMSAPGFMTSSLYNRRIPLATMPCSGKSLSFLVSRSTSTEVDGRDWERNTHEVFRRLIGSLDTFWISVTLPASDSTPSLLDRRLAIGEISAPVCTFSSGASPAAGKRVTSSAMFSTCGSITTTSQYTHDCCCTIIP
mmetsp:Transcript_115271/g.325738  ORF Transcript_115271/g.325738 Transcript_115271/m.325738 type:complete len:211 (+) Transcript_115271:642-1274(+)